MKFKDGRPMWEVETCAYTEVCKHIGHACNVGSTNFKKCEQHAKFDIRFDAVNDHQVAEDEALKGKKYDQGKPRWDLLPLKPIAGIVDVLTFAVDKKGYVANSWRKVEDPVERYYAALMRHVNAWRQGEEIDPESGLKHIEHALCNLVFLHELTNERK